MAHQGGKDEHTVWKVDEVKKIENSSEAQRLLLRVKEHADNVLRARGWRARRRRGKRGAGRCRAGGD